MSTSFVVNTRVLRLWFSLPYLLVLTTSPQRDDSHDFLACSTCACVPSRLSISAHRSTFSGSLRMLVFHRPHSLSSSSQFAPSTVFIRHSSFITVDSLAALSSQPAQISSSSTRLPLYVFLPSTSVTCRTLTRSMPLGLVVLDSLDTQPFDLLGAPSSCSPELRRPRLA